MQHVAVITPNKIRPSESVLTSNNAPVNTYKERESKLRLKPVKKLHLQPQTSHARNVMKKYLDKFQGPSPKSRKSKSP